MPVIKNKIIPIGKNFLAINLFGIIFAKGECSDIVLNHEKIHTRQMLELLVVPFYIWYLLEWLLNMVKYRNHYKAYLQISFEREAYANQYNLSYLTQRKPFSFRFYFSK